MNPLHLLRRNETLSYPSAFETHFRRITEEKLKELVKNLFHGIYSRSTFKVREHALPLIPARTPALAYPQKPIIQPNTTINYEHYKIQKSYYDY